MNSGGLLAAKRAEADRSALHQALTECPNLAGASLRLGCSLRETQILVERHGYPDEERERLRLRRQAATKHRRAMNRLRVAGQRMGEPGWRPERRAG